MGPGRRVGAAALLGAAFALVAPLLAAPASAQLDASLVTTLTAHGSVDQAYVEGATPGQRLEVLDAAGTVVGRGTVDRLGSLVVRGLAPSSQVRFVSTSGVRGQSNTVRVLGMFDPPPTSFFADQHLHEGLNYIEMRDGVRLAATVRLPPGDTLADGPFPTVIEYSGYAVAAPHSLITALFGGGSTSDPLLPDTATAVGSVIAPVLGFATVSLQMRGTGCSGGAFDLFGPDSITDGYDAVQIVGSQPWVAGHRVGLVGISYSGLSQFFVAGMRPPDLAAIAPMSPTDDFYSTAYPGGIYNTGFAAAWAAQRVQDAEPAPGGGQPWATAEIDAGDRTCLANQRLHLQALPLSDLAAADGTRVPALYDQRAPSYWARRIDVPVFLVGAVQDEQTGPQWPQMIPALAHDPDVFVTMVNGTHADSLGPGTITRWAEFLDLFVAHRLPSVPADVLALSGTLYQQLTGAPAEPLPALRFTHAPSVAAATADFVHQDPRVRVLFDNGGGSAGPGAMQPVWEADFSAWPPPPARATRLFLGPHGTLGAAPATASSASWRPNPAARPATDLSSSANVWAALPPYHWTPVTGSEGVGFVTAPLTHDEVVVGPASLDLWLRSSATDTDLQATVSDVRPDGSEMYVTSGFLRAALRADGPGTTELHPAPTYLAADERPLVPGRWTLVRVPIDPIAFAFRTGDRIRVTVSAPGGDRPVWSFATLHTGGRVVDAVSLGGAHPSSLVVAVVGGLTPPDPRPACPSLRGEPCRPYVPAGNGG